MEMTAGNYTQPKEDATPPCAECIDQAAAVHCRNCDEPFCRPCYAQQHRRGHRTQHKFDEIEAEKLPLPSGIDMSKDGAADAEPTSDSTANGASNTTTKLEAMDTSSDGKEQVMATKVSTRKQAHVDDRDALERMYREDYAYVPMRLTPEERRLLSLVEGALRVSEYTDNVDVRTYNRESRMVKGIEEMCHYLLGMNTCSDFKQGSRQAQATLVENAEFFQTCFEVARRYKIMNPDKMRSTYGKLMYLLQDACDKYVQKQVGFNARIPILTVELFCAQHGAPELLRDPLLLQATADVSLVHESKRQEALSAREEAKRMLVEKYSGSMSAEHVQRVLSSIQDSNTYQAQVAWPVVRMLDMLEEFKNESDYSLAIRAGKGGSKLTHSHKTQYTYVRQTLTLWREITQQMFYLWCCADQDLLRGASYNLWNTGQGLNRVQSCPAVQSAMSAVLRKVQSECGSWVGLSVVHLGDRDVPNALMFIDKYTQVPRILGPIVQCADRIQQLEKTHKPFVDTLQGADVLRQRMLGNFFRHGFNGDGDDGGSCIDGRLTSAWNWCSKLSAKNFHAAFLFSGFESFDGSFKE